MNSQRYFTTRFKNVVRASRNGLLHSRNRLLYWYGSRPSEFALRIPTHLTEAEKIVLFQTALCLPNRCNALEVGSYLGASAYVIGEAIRGLGGTLHCVDTWQNQAMDEPERDTWNQFTSNTCGLAATLVPHRGLSVEVSRELSVALDFLFLDGDHSEEAVESDLSAWLPKVKPGGVVAMHDIGWAEGVRKGIERHLKGRTSWETELPNLFVCRLRDDGLRYSPQRDRT